MKNLASASKEYRKGYDNVDWSNGQEYELSCLVSTILINKDIMNTTDNIMPILEKVKGMGYQDKIKNSEFDKVCEEIETIIKKENKNG